MIKLLYVKRDVFLNILYKIQKIKEKKQTDDEPIDNTFFQEKQKEICLTKN